MTKTRPLWVHVVSSHWLEMNPISDCIDHHAFKPYNPCGFFLCLIDC
jgi:hypothetical protein